MVWFIYGLWIMKLYWRDYFLACIQRFDRMRWNYLIWRSIDHWQYNLCTAHSDVFPIEIKSLTLFYPSFFWISQPCFLSAHIPESILDVVPGFIQSRSMHWSKELGLVLAQLPSVLNMQQIKITLKKSPAFELNKKFQKFRITIFLH